MREVTVAAVLDTFWGHVGKAPQWFKINPQNRTGQRLYSLIGTDNLLCTDAYPQAVDSPKTHGTPDPEWLASNLIRIRCQLLLVCGRVAQKTFRQCELTLDCQVLEMPHPTVWGWTREMLDEWREKIKDTLKGSDR